MEIIISVEDSRQTPSAYLIYKGFAWLTMKVTIFNGIATKQKIESEIFKANKSLSWFPNRTMFIERYFHRQYNAIMFVMPPITEMGIKAIPKSKLSISFSEKQKQNFSDLKDGWSEKLTRHENLEIIGLKTRQVKKQVLTLVIKKSNKLLK